MRPLTAPSKSRNRSRGSGRHRRAMTLVEVLLAVTLFSSLLGATGALLQAGFRAQALWGGAVEPAARMDRAFIRIEGDVASSQKLFAIAAQGTADQWSFARVEPVEADGVAALSWVKLVYRMAQENGQRFLIREEYPWPKSAQDASASRRETLLPVENIAWSFARLNEQGQLAWTNEWDGTVDGTPRLVRLTCAIPITGQNPLLMARVFRNPSGNLPQVKPQ